MTRRLKFEVGDYDLENESGSEERFENKQGKKLEE
jgi:hypothetical protein